MGIGWILLILIYVALFLIIVGIVIYYSNKRKNDTPTTLANEDVVIPEVTPEVKEVPKIIPEISKVVAPEPIPIKSDDLQVIELMSDQSDSDNEIDELDLKSIDSSDSDMELDNEYIDIVKFKDEVLYLLSNNVIIARQGNKDRLITINQEIKRITPYRDDILAHDYNKMYLVSNDVNTNSWIFEEAINLPSGVLDVSYPRDFSCLYIRCDNKVYILDGDLKEVRLNPDYKRIYGNTKDSYIELNTITNVLYDRTKEMSDNVLDAVLKDDDEISIIYIDSNKGNRLLYIDSVLTLMKYT